MLVCYSCFKVSARRITVSSAIRVWTVILKLQKLRVNVFMSSILLTFLFSFFTFKKRETQPFPLLSDLLLKFSQAVPSMLIAFCHPMSYVSTHTHTHIHTQRERELWWLHMPHESQTQNICLQISMTFGDRTRAGRM